MASGAPVFSFNVQVVPLGSPSMCNRHMHKHVGLLLTARKLAASCKQIVVLFTNLEGAGFQQKRCFAKCARYQYLNIDNMALMLETAATCLGQPVVNEQERVPC